MAKERFLTVLIPIKDSDCEPTIYNDLAELVSDVPPSASNVNKIYMLKDGTYRRSGKNALGQYAYKTVTDREFPYLGNPLNIYDFTYDATRMGTAPTISAQGVMWYADKDGSGNDVTLEGLWTQQCHVVFNGENLYLKKVPTSSKSNEDARYKYDLDFVAERVALENVYIYDVVQPFITEKPISENATFSFFGDINELAKRINASLIRSGLAELTRKYVGYPQHPSTTVQYLSYEQWNQMNVDGFALIGDVFVNQAQMLEFYNSIYLELNGDYNRYLIEYIFENTNGVFDLVGYQCIIGKDKYGEITTSEEKLVTFDKNTIHEALQQFHDTFELQYYIVKEKVNGAYTGNTLIMVEDCEHDFADIDLLTGDYVRDDDGIPTTENPFDYGVDNELLSKEKTNTTDKIVTRITGVGSTDNIPWHYPNPTPDGWIKPIFHRMGEEVNGVTVDYPIDEGVTVADSIRYEKFLKNRIGNTIKKGHVVTPIYENNYRYLGYEYAPRPNTPIHIKAKYIIDTTAILNAEITLELYYNEALSGCSSISAKLYRDDTEVGSYKSWESYQDPTYFQTMFTNRNGKDRQPLASNYNYLLDITFSIPYASMPLSQRYDYTGYLYPAETIAYSGSTGSYTDEQGKVHIISVVDETAYIGQNFYQYEGLVAHAEWYSYSVWYDPTIHETQGHFVDYIRISYAGYCIDEGNDVYELWNPIPRISGNKYKDASVGIIYSCSTSEIADVRTGEYQDGVFSANPYMSYQEWLTTFVDMTIRLYANDGWYIGDNKINLIDYGLSEPYIDEHSAYYTYIFDEIVFQRLKWVTPQSNLMPEVFIKTDGEKRFYNAKNYWDIENNRLIYGTADTTIGEVQVSMQVRNPIFKDEETDADSEHYEFETEYVKDFAHEHIEDFDDVKPTIEGQQNYCAVEISDDVAEDWANQYQNYFTKNQDGTFTNATSTYNDKEIYYMLLRIDVVEEFAYDLTDNDEIWEDNSNGSIQNEYKHPYFFAKLRPMGFNIFDLALQDDMVLSMTTGHCGACNFRIGVDENTKKNPVQIWEYDVYGGETFADKGDKLYSKGDLRRYGAGTNLMYNTNDTEAGYISVDAGVDIIEGSGGFWENSVSSTPMYQRYEYSSEQVANGFVGSTKKDGKAKFEGDVVTSGRFIEGQQNTAENFVWVALFKDTETYGMDAESFDVIMPSARPNYNNPNLNVYIRPKSVTDVHVEADPEHSIDESTYTEDEENADKFVLINIRMPQAYLRRAEHKLAHKLVKYMYEHNWQKFNFSLKFSRIYIAQNPSTDNDLNENSVLYVLFNGNIYRQYAKHYTYRMSHSEALPEISVDMNEDLTVTKTLMEQWDEKVRNSGRGLSSSMKKSQRQLQSRMEKTTLQKNETNVIYGNTVIGETRMSLLEIGEGGGNVGTITFEEIDIITSN